MQFHSLVPQPGRRRYLVTGGAGFVGSHIVLALSDRGDDVVVIDNLSQGHREVLPPGVTLVHADLNDIGAVNEVLRNGPWDAVLHFAAQSLVGDSMARPFHYFRQNASVGIELINACVEQGVRRFVLSSTANLFGTPDVVPILETARIDPSSPYGESKWMLERALHWADRVHGLRSACLRYFNAAGADPMGRAGEDHSPETHLIPLVIDAALGRRPELQVFGTDYPTPDGTCVRDYVHVTDLASAHLLALDRLDLASVAYNVGCGTGYSVRQVIDAVERVSGRRVPVRVLGRRAGDPPILVSSSAKLSGDTGWAPIFTRLDDIVRTAHDWRIAHPDGYRTIMHQDADLSRLAS